ncbi:MAG: hypothetical protein CV081_11870 [Nitrospira sp. LK265]|nr:hypothetical protein [Nitrospira sp. LK265]
MRLAVYGVPLGLVNTHSLFFESRRNEKQRKLAHSFLAEAKDLPYRMQFFTMISDRLTDISKILL